jgi:hypothetical protein
MSSAARAAVSHEQFSPSLTRAGGDNGRNDAGAAIRWMFAEITRDSFHLDRQTLTGSRRDMASAGGVLCPSCDRLGFADRRPCDHKIVNLKKDAEAQRAKISAARAKAIRVPEKSRGCVECWPEQDGGWTLRA